MNTVQRLTWEDEADAAIREVFDRNMLSAEQRQTINRAIRGIAATRGEYTRSALVMIALHIRSLM